MARPAPHVLDDDPVQVPRTVKFPVELEVPPGFDPADTGTWPRVEGRLEWVGGRLLWMPPCGALQQTTVADVVLVLGLWVRAHPEFVLGSNEAGVRLGADTRAADAAIWPRRALGRPDHQLRRTPPLLAVEVSGRDERETALRAKARWYVDAGTTVVWIVLIEPRRVVVLTRDGETTHGLGETLPMHPALPDLAPPVAELFRQVLATE